MLHAWHAIIGAMEPSPQKSSAEQPVTPPAPTESAPKTEVKPESSNPTSPSNPRRFTGVKAFLSVLAFVVGIIVAATLINQFIFQSYYVDGTSMTPTLHNNDRLIIDKVERTMAIASGHHYIPKRGQIVVLDSSLVDQTGHNEQLIKRVIGLPGDTITIGSDGNVIIKNKDNPNGFNANQTLGLNLAPSYVDDAPYTVTVPENDVFVMGDNRGPGGSFDSRSFGPVDSNKIEGRLLARIFPLNQTKFF
jgi:signal peptidase I